MRFVPLLALVAWCGATLLIAGTRWARRPALRARVAPHLLRRGPQRPHRGGRGVARPDRDPAEAAGIVAVLTPVASALGGRAAAALGVREALGRRLERVHDPIGPAVFRLRQLAWATGGLAAGATVALVVGPPVPIAALAVLGTPMLAFCIPEHHLAQRSQAWQRAVRTELPLVAEQLGLLLGAGASLGAALGRLAADRGGACGADLTRLVGRIRHGVSEADALREWAEIVDVPAVRRFVALLALDRDAGDLARLVGEEARVLRQEAHRELLAAVERRGQLVWIPVTVAALVPGVILVAVPFLEVMNRLGAS